MQEKIWFFNFRLILQHKMFVLMWEKDPQWYAVQEGDASMISIAKMPGQ